jgi:hypothetical protein
MCVGCNGEGPDFRQRRWRFFVTVPSSPFLWVALHFSSKSTHTRECVWESLDSLIPNFLLFPRTIAIVFRSIRVWLQAFSFRLTAQSSILHQSRSQIELLVYLLFGRHTCPFTFTSPYPHFALLFFNAICTHSTPCPSALRLITLPISEFSHPNILACPDLTCSAWFFLSAPKRPHQQLLARSALPPSFCTSFRLSTTILAFSPGFFVCRARCLHSPRIYSFVFTFFPGATL